MRRRSCSPHPIAGDLLTDAPAMGDEIAEMFASLDGRDRMWEQIERAREQKDHGYFCYTMFRCRCDVCRAANAAYMRAYNKARRRRDPAFRAKRSRYQAERRARQATRSVS